MLLRKCRKMNMVLRSIKIKSLSGNLRTSLPYFPRKQLCAKVLQCALRKGSFTVEAAFVLPLFLFAAVVILGFFPVLQVQIQVNGGLQYAARIMAVSFQEETDEGTILSLAEGQILFRRYMREHEFDEEVLTRGLNSISFLRSDLSGDYVTLVADYDVPLPISFWHIRKLPVAQSVRVKKWTGADPESTAAETYSVFITPNGSAYHTTTECPYLRLSVRSVSASAVSGLRSQDRNIYYPCSCYKGQSRVYITDYGTEYHGDLSCSNLKRTIYKVNKDEIGNRHACAKCAAGDTK